MKNEGDLVVEEEPLVEVETDKLTTSLPAASSGFLHKIFYKSQEVCPVIIWLNKVGKILCEIRLPEGSSVISNNEKKANTVMDDIMNQQKDVKSQLLSNQSNKSNQSIL